MGSIPQDVQFIRTEYVRILEVLRSHGDAESTGSEQQGATPPELERAFFLRLFAEFEGSLRRHFDLVYLQRTEYFRRKGSGFPKWKHILATEYYTHFVEKSEVRMRFRTLFINYIVALGRRLDAVVDLEVYEEIIDYRDWLAHGRVGRTPRTFRIDRLWQWIQQVCECIPGFPDE